MHSWSCYLKNCLAHSRHCSICRRLVRCLLEEGGGEPWFTNSWVWSKWNRDFRWFFMIVIKQEIGNLHFYTVTNRRSTTEMVKWAQPTHNRSLGCPIVGFLERPITTENGRRDWRDQKQVLTTRNWVQSNLPIINNHNKRIKSGIVPGAGVLLGPTPSATDLDGPCGCETALETGQQSHWRRRRGDLYKDHPCEKPLGKISIITGLLTGLQKNPGIGWRESLPDLPHLAEPLLSERLFIGKRNSFNRIPTDFQQNPIQYINICR